MGQHDPFNAASSEHGRHTSDDSDKGTKKRSMGKLQPHAVLLQQAPGYKISLSI
jgi:hypothetical protein